MTTILTTAGSTHYTELQAGGALTNTYGTLLFGRGNDAPVDGDTVAEVSDIIVLTPQASPVLGDIDVQNSGRGADIYTWTFNIPPQTEPWVASNVALATNGAALADPLAVHALQTIWSEPYRALKVFINIGASAATVVSAYQEDAIEAARLRSTGARADILFGGSGSQNLKVGQVYTQVRAGESVPLRGQLYSESGLRLTADQILGVRRVVEEYVPGSDSFKVQMTQLLDDCYVELSTNESSALFPYRGGFNFKATLPGQFTRSGQDKRIKYEIQLSDGNTRVLEQLVRVQG